MVVKIKYQDSTAKPICPFCNQEMDVIERVLPAKIEMRRVNVTTYICPHCKKVLGFA
jgi:uncharacterized protein with PIN domain